jgi:hypothetical protein
MEYYTYCFIRKDLPLVQQIIQMGHANYKAAHYMEYAENPNIVLFEVESQEELMEIRTFLSRNKLDHVMFFDDISSIKYSSIVVEPICDLKIRELFKDFRLYQS